MIADGEALLDGAALLDGVAIPDGIATLDGKYLSRSLRGRMTTWQMCLAGLTRRSPTTFGQRRSGSWVETHDRAYATRGSLRAAAISALEIRD